MKFALEVRSGRPGVARFAEDLTIIASSDMPVEAITSPSSSKGFVHWPSGGSKKGLMVQYTSERSKLRFA